MTLSLKIQEIKMDAREEGRAEGIQEGRKEAQTQLAQRDSKIAELEARLAKYEAV